MTRFLARLLATGALVLSLALQACTTAPATGRNIFTGGMTPEDEVRTGRQEHPKILAEFGGAYDDPEVRAYVSSLGALLARTSELPNLDWHFTVLDTPMINAFALPGGYVYVTRGLLALADNEAELAGVLAHEIGHVTARHPAERYGQQVLGSVAALSVGVLLGSGSGGGGGALASDAVGLALLSYSREQEYEADFLGVRYLARTGHDPHAMAGFLERLLAHDRFRAEQRGRPGDADAFDITKTHPRTADRIERAIQQAGVRDVPDPIIARDLYLRKIDGMVYGDSPEQGFVRGRRFSHPELGFTFEVPEGFVLQNTAKRVLAQGPQGALIAFDRADQPGYGTMTSYLADDWAQGITLQGLQAIDVNGMEAATAWTRLNGRSGTEDWRLVAIRLDRNSVYRFMFVTPSSLTSSLSAPLRRTTYSFRRLSRAEASALQPYRLAIYRVRSGDTARRIAHRMPVEDEPLEHFLVLNGLDAGEGLRTGQKVKIVSR
jgi:predicted Zn-dependent protease